MQYASGTNSSEPTSNDTKSTSWKFILRGASYPNLPECFVPHCTFVAWISSPQGRSGTFLLRGYIQFMNRTSYITLKRRYSKEAEWIPVPWNDARPYAEIALNPYPYNATRYIHGVPISQSSTHTQIPLPKVGLNSEVLDLIEAYHIEIWNLENFIPDEVLQEERERKKRKRQLQEETEAQLLEQELSHLTTPHQFFTTDSFGQQRFSGGRTSSGKYYTAYDPKRGRFND